MAEVKAKGKERQTGFFLNLSLNLDLQGGMVVAATNRDSLYFTDERGSRDAMVLVYESDPLDDEHARGRFYHVCRGRIDRTPLDVPPADRPHECQQCGIDLEAEDFFMALQKGSV